MDPAGRFQICWSPFPPPPSALGARHAPEILANKKIALDGHLGCRPRRHGMGVGQHLPQVGCLDVLVRRWHHLLNWRGSAGDMGVGQSPSCTAFPSPVEPCQSLSTLPNAVKPVKQTSSNLSHLVKPLVQIQSSHLVAMAGSTALRKEDARLTFVD